MNTPNTQRPKRNSEAVIKAAAEKLFPKVWRWIQDYSNESEPCDREEVVRQLATELKWKDDGYAIAKRLEAYGWSPDSELVSILDDSCVYKGASHRESVAEWVKTSGLVAPSVGARMRCRDGKPTTHTGHVVRNDEAQGCAVVCFPALGHSAEPSNKSHTIGLHIPWEDLIVDATQPQPV